MKLSDIPTKIQTAFAQDAAASFRATIPQAGAGIGRATWTQGFSPLNFQPIASGGIPPYGADMNGVLFSATVWLKWLNAGGAQPYDATFQTQISGYPKGAVVLDPGISGSVSLGWWYSLVDDNTTDPTAAGAGWMLIPFIQVFAGNPNGHIAGYGAGTSPQSVPPSVTWDTTNKTFWWCSSTGPASGGGQAVWLPLTILTPVGSISTGAANNYTAADDGTVKARSNGGSAMGDTLPSANSTADGWNMKFVNVDATATLTISAPGGTTLNGVSAGNVALTPGQTCAIVFDGTTHFYKTVVPFTPQQAAGSNGNVQFNNSGVLGASGQLNWVNGSNLLQAANISVGTLLTAATINATNGVVTNMNSGNFTGTWNGNPIAINKGGTGLTSMPFTPGNPGTVLVPPGVYFQFGLVTVNASNSQTVTLPTPLSIALLGVQLTPINTFGGSGVSGNYAAGNYQLTSFDAFNNMPANLTFSWLAIGA